MPRAKKQRLKRRADGYYVCRYKDQWFYSLDEDDCLAQREEFKRLERSGEINLLTGPKLKDYADKWITRAYPSVAKTTMVGLKIHLRKLTDSLGDSILSDIRPSDVKAIYSEKYVGMSNSYIKA